MPRSAVRTEPSALFDPVPSADLVRAGTEGITDLLHDLDGDTTNVLLTLARIWHTCEAGTITTKDAAATWAAERADGAPRHVLGRARDAYVRGEPHTWGPVDDDVRDTAAFLTAAIDDAALRSKRDQRGPRRYRVNAAAVPTMIGSSNATARTTATTRVRRRWRRWRSLPS